MGPQSKPSLHRIFVFILLSILLCLIVTSVILFFSRRTKVTVLIAEAPPVSFTTSEYIANKSTGKVHDSDCSYLPSKENRVYYDDLQDALDDGYEPCKKCHPER